PGATLPEISAFCEGISKKSDDIAPHKDFNSWLVARGVEHIQTDGIRYIEAREEENVAPQDKGEVSLEADSGLVQSIKETLNNIAQVPDASYHDILRQELMKDITQLAPERLQDLFTNKELQSGPLMEVLENLIISLPTSKVEEII